MFQGNVIQNAHDFQGGYNCISIPDGMTIAYKEQVIEILHLLSDIGLPPFGSLILILLATNSGEVDAAIKEVFSKTLKEFTQYSKVDHIDYASAESFLKTLRMLPEVYKKGQKRTDLFLFLFELFFQSNCDPNPILLNKNGSKSC